MLKLVVLPAPFGPEEPDHLAGRHAERDPVHDLPAAVALHEPDGLEGVAAHGAGSFFLRGASSIPGWGTMVPLAAVRVARSSARS